MLASVTMNTSYKNCMIGKKIMIGLNGKNLKTVGFTAIDVKDIAKDSVCAMLANASGDKRSLKLRKMNLKLK